MAPQPWGAIAAQTQNQTPATVQPPVSQPMPIGDQISSDISDIIVKAAAKNKFLDFRNGLVLARPADYAMVHGIGGKDHAPRSVIRCMITDYGVKPTVSAYANLAPELFPYIMSVCEKNSAVAFGGQQTQTGAPENELVATLNRFVGQALPPDLVPGSSEPHVAIPAPVMRDIQAASQEDAAAKAVIDSVRGTKPLPADASGVDYIAVSQRLVNALLTSLQNVQSAAPAVSAGGQDFFYKQDRVNVYKKENGMCPVSVITINRVGLRKNGEVSRLPWTISIQNFMAPPVEQKNGTTSYSARGIDPKSKKECTISVSDFDMYKCCYRVCRFIELWELTQWPPILQSALEQKAATRNQ